MKRTSDTNIYKKKTFIKEPDETDRAKTYAEISAEQPKARRQRPNPAEKKKTRRRTKQRSPLPQRTTGGRRNTQLEDEATRQTYPRRYPESPTLSNRNTIDGNDDIRNTRDVFYVRRKVDLMKTAKVNAYIMHIFGKIELLSTHTT